MNRNKTKKLPKLNPCPFCGAVAFGPYIAHIAIPADHERNHFQVACSDHVNCGAVITGGRLKTERAVIEHWNAAPEPEGG